MQVFWNDNVNLCKLDWFKIRYNKWCILFSGLTNKCDKSLCIMGKYISDFMFIFGHFSELYYALTAFQLNFKV